VIVDSREAGTGTGRFATGTKMSKVDSQVQHPFFAGAQQKMVEGVQRMASFAEECGKFEQQVGEQALKAIDESARLQREAVAYGLRLQAQWRAMVVDASRAAVEFAAPGA
jgi:ribosomal protein L31